MTDRLRWGILGTGNIARQFAAGVRTSLRGTLAAVGSRTLDSARQFGATFDVRSSYGNYADVLSDSTVDAVYVSLPNSMHHEWTIKALRAGKHVLCEKPFAIDAHQSNEMFDVAEREKRVLVEAFMYRSHPQTKKLLDLVRGGAIGELRVVRAHFCFKPTNTAGNIRFDRSLAGGSLMDIGCYCISFARLFAGTEPTQVQAVGHLHESGIDDRVAGCMQFENGVLATFLCGLSAHNDNTAFLCGSEGYIEIPFPWKPPEKSTFTVCRSAPPRMDNPTSGANTGQVVHAGPSREVFEVDTTGVGLYGVEADDFAATVLDGAPPAVSRQDTVGNMHVIDTIRKQIGLTF